jgi:hypothetical protein
MEKLAENLRRHDDRVLRQPVKRPSAASRRSAPLIPSA